MQAILPKNFVQVADSEFMHLMDGLNVEREAYCGGVYYRARDYQKRVVGVALDEPISFFVDPDFFPGNGN